MRLQRAITYLGQLLDHKRTLTETTPEIDHALDDYLSGMEKGIIGPLQQVRYVRCFCAAKLMGFSVHVNDTAIKTIFYVSM